MQTKLLRIIRDFNNLISIYGEEEHKKKAREIFKNLSVEMPTAWDSRGNIGKRYLYQDEIGTPFCITVDYESLDKKTVTVRDRDDTTQDRVAIADLSVYLKAKIE